MNKNKFKQHFIIIFLILFISINIYIIQSNNISSDIDKNNREALPINLKSSLYNYTTTEVVSSESTEASLWPSIAIDSLGNIHVVWADKTNYTGCSEISDDFDIFYKQWNNSLKDWTNTEVVSTESTSDSLYPSIAIDSLNNIHIAWNDNTNYTGCKSVGEDYDIFYKVWNSTIKNWTNTEVVSSESTNSSEIPSIAIDSLNNIHIAWEDKTNYTGCKSVGEDYDIFYKQWNSTIKDWTNTEVVSTESTDYSTCPSIAIDSLGNIHVAWYDQTNYSACKSAGEDYDIFYKQWNNTIKDWTNTEVVSTESYKNSYNPSITTNVLGNVHITWEDITPLNSSGDESDIFYKQWNNTIKDWTITEVVSTESTDYSTCPSIAIDSLGNIHIAWYDQTNYSACKSAGENYDIFYKQWNNTIKDWTLTDIISTESDAESSWPKIAIDGSNNVHVVWNDRTDYNGCKNSVSDFYDIFYKCRITHNIPSVNYPTDIETTKFGTETIDWIITDDVGAGMYRVFINDIILERDWTPWDNNTIIHMPINRNSPGTFYYTIEYYDTFKVYGINDTVTVVIEDGNPIINHPIDHKIEKGQSLVIEWIITDDFGDGFYRIFLNDISSGWDTWESDATIQYSLKTSVIGVFNITIQYQTSTGQIGYDTVMVEITPSGIQIFFDFLPYLIVIISSILVIASSVIILKRRKHKQIVMWKEKTKIFSDILNIDLILIIHKETGSAIVSHNFSEQTMDGDLIGGFLQAMTSFKYEIKKFDTTQTSKGSTLLDYEHYKILIKDGEFIRVAIILNSDPSNLLENAFYGFIEEFETRFNTELKQFHGKITTFQNSIDLINKYFNISLIYPHCTSKKASLKELNSFQEYIIKMAKNLESKTGMFHMSQLINYIIADKPNELKEKIIANIIDLRQLGFLELANP